ncbi:beta strand repeat-containing protein [Bdellovibrio sp. HCB209]|uniref:beta strand repeat-containing protein n=1 Tax=Bdellovibrio sp. HCB209 TaxID=3394354 RepID=UPI0039B645E0
MQNYRRVALTSLFSLITFASSKSVAVAWNYANTPGTYGDIEFTTSGTLPAGTYTFNNLTINSGVTVTLTGNTSTTEGSGVVIFAASVNHLGIINGNGKGFSSQAGPGPGRSGSSGSGGSHGGLGGWGSNGSNPPTIAYGSAVEPTALGSGGGSGGGGGGAGGGAIKIIATGSINIGGAINVNGSASPDPWSGGGAAGSIWIEGDAITGLGALNAKGGAGGGAGAGAGSGGRIYLAYQSSRTHSGALDVTSGGGTAMYGSGIVVKKSSPTSLTILVNSTLSNGTYTYNDITIPAGVTATMTGMGYPGQSGPGAGSNGSESTGASHGGVGGGTSPPAPYGNAIAPTTLGSGGGSMSANTGGYGGGAIKFVAAGTMTVSGTLSSNGSATSGDAWTAAGSGGSIWIDAGTWAGGSSGAITANGGGYGAAVFNGGASGGRIYIEYSTKTYTGATPVASKSGSAVNGSAILKDKLTGSYDCNSQTITVDASAISSISNISVTAVCSLIVNGDLFPVSVSVSGSGAKLTVNGNLLVTSTIDISSGGALVIGSNKLSGVGYIVSAASVTVGAGSSFNADGMGYNNGLGAGAGGIGNGSGGGGGYGGAGGSGYNGAGGATYGWAVNPIHIGSSGGNSNTGSPPDSIGSAGGGAIILVVPGTVQVNGTLSANGANGTSMAGPGSGGTVNIVAGTVQGTGYIRANGGAGSAPIGGGGGGRIYIVANTWSFTTANVTVAGGTGTVAGSAGSFPGVVTATTATSLDFVEPLQSSIRKNAVFDPIPIIVGKDGSGRVDRNFSSTVTFSAFSDAACTIPASGTLTNSNADNPLQFAPINGVGIFPGVYYNTSHTVYVQGSAGALKTPCEELIVGGSVATHLVFTIQPADTTQANVVMARQPVIEARDADGVVDTLASISALGVYSDATCSTYVGSLTAGTGSNTAGVTTYSGVRYTKSGVFYLKASSTTDGISVVGCSQVFEITPGAATKLAFETSPGTSVAGSNFTPQPVVEVRDTWDNLIPSATDSVSFVVVATTGTCTSAATVAGTFTGAGPYTAIGGQVTGSGMSFTKAQAVRLRATASGLTTGCSSNFTINAAALADLVWVTQPPAAANVNVNFSSPVVTVGGRDMYGNTRTLSSGTFTLASFTDASCATAGVPADLTTSGTGFTSGNWRVNTATYKKAGTFYFKVSTSGAETPCSTGTVFTVKLAPWFFRGY